VSTGVIAGLIWISFAARHPRAAAAMSVLVERIPRTMTRRPNVVPSAQLTGYSA
jgi:hypothetical protein